MNLSSTIAISAKNGRNPPRSSGSGNFQRLKIVNISVTFTLATHPKIKENNFWKSDGNSNYS